ncbi:Beta-citrylglutamate synthase B [Liparis tanakae]|uniref:Beta-citrylglutamate synthase B n=1 Tax=Liparis tanakae TaxID=230148 RepID=A0A4Z2JC03_9TELE|nr:Beta-citrylglutamate synthase B [Liparis tanakae]
MCSRVWFVTDRRISQEYPQVQILRALKERCTDEDVEFRSLLMDQIVLTISEGQLGNLQDIPDLFCLLPVSAPSSTCLCTELSKKSKCWPGSTHGYPAWRRGAQCMCRHIGGCRFLLRMQKASSFW